jgi:hypothetical protein
MSSDRPVATDALGSLGTTPIPDDAGRDAIHLAVEPVVSEETLFPGQKIGFADEAAKNARVVTTKAKPLGIVDPFIPGPVYPGNKFWLVVFPRQITSLRHVWEHPAFAETATIEIEKIIEKKVIVKMTNDETEMFRWAALLGYKDADSLASALDRVVASGIKEDYITGYGNDWGGIIDDDLWDVYERYRGVVVPREVRNEKYFSCSC